MIKSNGEIVEVLSAYTNFVGNTKKVFVEAVSKYHGYVTLSHKEIR